MLNNLFSIKGKIALVTGGNTGIGFAIAQALTGAGAHVIIANRNVEEGKQAMKKISEAGGMASAYPVDVARKESVKALFEYVSQTFGRLDILVNNAGINRQKPIMDFSDEDWDAVMAIDLRGSFWCSKEAFNLMKENGGKIINIGSITVYKCLNNGSSTYSVIKAGVNQLTKVCAVEWAPFGIRVNAIAPGVCITRINREHYERNPDLLERVSAGIPLKYLSKPDDYQGIVIFLASDASSYMTGQTIYMDGGMSLI